MDKTIADRMAEAAEIDLGLPYSLTLDAWNLAGKAGFTDPAVGEWMAFLIDALDAYDADQLGYWTDERRARSGGDDGGYDPADDGE